MANLLAVRIQVSIQPADYSSGGLNLNQEFKVDQLEFMEVCKILGQFNDLAKKIEAERGIRN